MKIYCGAKSFTRDCRPRWLLDELGLAYERIDVDIFAGAGRSDEYLARNATGKVPFLEDGEVAIFESGAIVTYLADTYGVPALAPELTSPDRARYLQWMFYAPATLDGPTTRLFAARYLYPSREGAEERARAAEHEFSTAARALERGLGERTHLLGDRFSAADVMIGSALVWADRAGGLVRYPVLKRYLGTLSERPSFQRVFAPTEREYHGHEGR
jgi:glutathione S-transferase